VFGDLLFDMLNMADGGGASRSYLVVDDGGDDLGDLPAPSRAVVVAG
jgi:hypothetical protein